MAIITGQVTAVSTAPTLLCAVPPGPSVATITNSTATAANIVYVGLGTTVTSSNGAPVVAGASISIPGATGSKGSQIYVISGAGSPVVGFIVSTPQ
jgi:hypothetical protein